MYQRLLYGLGAPVTKSFPLGLTKYKDILLVGLVTCSNMCALLLNF